MQIEINNDQKELKKHGEYSFPFYISHEKLSNYERMEFLWHWHPEMELTLVLDGEMTYKAGIDTYHLLAGDVLFCNSNILHSGQNIHKRDCKYLSITFHPRFLYGYKESLFYTSYLLPFISAGHYHSICIKKQESSNGSLQSSIEQIQTCYQSKESLFEWRIHLLIEQCMLTMFETTDFSKNTNLLSNEQDYKRLQNILYYIKDHYTEKMELSAVAECIHLSKSECCRFFKKYTNETIFDYLLKYRLEQSIKLLKESDLSITEIALQTGFSTASYFTSSFKKEMQMTPLAYRKNAAVS